MKLLTRKDLKDPYGERTIYVVEVKSNGDHWWPLSLCSTSYSDAMIEKENAHLEHKGMFKFWTRKRVRVVVYERAEKP